MKTKLNAAEWLADNGWRERNTQLDKCRCFYRRFDTPTPCACNQDKPGIQVKIEIWNHNGIESYDIRLTGQLADGTWVEITNYSLPRNIEQVAALAPRMITLWEAANKPTP